MGVPLLLFLLGLTIGQPAGAAVEAKQETVDLGSVEITLDQQWSTLTVHLKLATPASQLYAPKAEPAGLLPGSTQNLGMPIPTQIPPPRSRTWSLPHGVADVSYQFSTAFARDSRRPLSSEHLLTDPGRWLWLPALAPGQTLRITVALPQGVSLSTPWIPLASTTPGRGAGPSTSPRSEYLLGSTANSGRPTLAFTSQRLLSLDTHWPQGKSFELFAPKQEADALSADRLQRWLAPVADAVIDVLGQPPQQHTQIVVLGTGRHQRSPVPFGQVMRTQGAAVRLFVDASRSAEEFSKDWTATHEFAHLLLPHVKQKWLSEGFASYYQNILQARLGRYTELEMWHRLVNSFAKAAGVANPVGVNALQRHSFAQMRMLIYWRGAALALAADVALRQNSGGKRSLDTALAALHDEFAPYTHSWDARDLLQQLDKLEKSQVFVRLYQHAQVPGMPELSALFAELGIERRRSGQSYQVSLSDRAPLAQVRRAITRSLHQ